MDKTNSYGVLFENVEKFEQAIRENMRGCKEYTVTEHDLNEVMMEFGSSGFFHDEREELENGLVRYHYSCDFELSQFHTKSGNPVLVNYEYECICREELGADGEVEDSEVLEEKFVF